MGRLLLLLLRVGYIPGLVVGVPGWGVAAREEEQEQSNSDATSLKETSNIVTIVN